MHAIDEISIADEQILTRFEALSYVIGDCSSDMDAHHLANLANNSWMIAVPDIDQNGPTSTPADW
ncbi:hypothetical protein [Corynebacterium striatum]|uniref:hypothetical protein n=1 Tax=Corynebacterium striatum TaxID=43770 RepID=UPI0034D47C66